MKTSFTCLLIGAAIIFTAVSALGQSASFKGFMFGDAYYLAAHDDGDVENSLEEASGVWFRRIYLTFDFKLDDTWSARLRSEMNSPGDFTSKAKLVPFIKDAYGRWKSGSHQITLGLSSTPTWDMIEGFWGYRSVEKTPLDLQKFGSSRDIGVAFKGSLDKAKKVQYNLMLANGGGTSSETNNGKKALLSVGIQPSETIILEGYVDYDNRPGETDRYTIQGFGGFQKGTSRVGVLYAFQNRDVEDGESVTLSLLSVFGAVPLSDKVSGFARFDRMFDPNPDAGKISYLPFDPGFKSNMVIVGIDFQPQQQVHLMPNIEAVFYESDGLNTTIMPRLTFWIIFK